MKVFINKSIQDTALQLLRDAGCEVTQWIEDRDLTKDELIKHCQGIDILFIAGRSKIDKEFLNSCPHLKAIVLNSVGYNHVDVAEANRLKIPVSNTPDVLTDATADIAFLLMLSVSRKAIYMHKAIVDGNWGNYNPTANLGIELKNKTLGIFGLGKIGFAMAKRCVEFYNMKVIYHNRSSNSGAEASFNAKRVSFDELLYESDVLSVHASLMPELEGTFNKAAFAKMKSSSIFINTARGGFHNELDLIEALETGQIWGAGLDVTNPEPMLPDNPLLNMPTVAVLPHIGSATVETRNAMAETAALNAIAAAKGERLPNILNPEVYL
jgi:glyoxylate reductase